MYISIQEILGIIGIVLSLCGGAFKLGFEIGKLQKK